MVTPTSLPSTLMTTAVSLAALLLPLKTRVWSLVMKSAPLAPVSSVMPLMLTVLFLSGVEAKISSACGLAVTTTLPATSTMLASSLCAPKVRVVPL